MKKYFLSLAILFYSLLANAQGLNVMTFNIRYNNTGDSLDAWPYRKDKAVSQILYHEVHLLGVQEALANQMADLRASLPQFKGLGGGREDGKEKGEYSAIFYDTTRLQLLQTHMIWLSATPEVVGSIGWDAALTRVMTWAKFKDKKTKRIFFAFNTHFDHKGEVARRESAKLVLSKIKEIAGNVPAVCTGDFNAEPADEPIRVIMDKANPLHLTDSKEISQTPHYGPTGTFTAFKTKERSDYPIDYIFLKGKWKVTRHATISETWGGRYASDHFSVLATLVL